MDVFPTPYFLLLGKNTLLEIQTNSLKPICQFKCIGLVIIIVLILSYIAQSLKNSIIFSRGQCNHLLHCFCCSELQDYFIRTL